MKQFLYDCKLNILLLFKLERDIINVTIVYKIIKIMKELKRVWLRTVFSREKKQLSDEIWIRQVWNNKNPLHVMKLLLDTRGVRSWYKLEKELEE